MSLAYDVTRIRTLYSNQITFDHVKDVKTNNQPQLCVMNFSCIFIIKQSLKITPIIVINYYYYP